MAADTAPIGRTLEGDVPPRRVPERARPLAQAGPVAAPGADLSGLVVDKIGKSFGGRQVVRDVSLTLRRGQVAGLLGPNGAGKTTCFYMITGLGKPNRVRGVYFPDKTAPAGGAPAKP